MKFRERGKSDGRGYVYKAGSCSLEASTAMRNKMMQIRRPNSIFTALDLNLPRTESRAYSAFVGLRLRFSACPDGQKKGEQYNIQDLFVHFFVVK